MDVKWTPIFGSVLNQNPLKTAANPVIIIPGTFREKHETLNLNRDTLSRHMMLIGGTGCGKSNVFYHIIDQARKKMSTDDVMIIFDPKGDYYELFGTSKDAVIGGGKHFQHQSEKWNIFKEIIADGWDEKPIALNTQEISWSIFKESVEKSKDPFFPNAARDLFAAVLMCMFEEGKNDPDYRKDCLYNSELKRALDEATIQDVKAMLEAHPRFAAALSYIGDGTSAQALGVYAEMLSTTRKMFSAGFDDKGMFSIRDFVKNKGGKTLFVEYDISVGDTLAPIYSLLFDLALKEALGRKKSIGDVYLICDEFRLIPYLQHIDDAVNFGRSLGVKVIAGLQSINQLTEAYGEYRGKNILAGFSSIFAFRANDMYTRDYIVGLYGKNVVMEQYKTISNSLHEERRESHVVEDWDMSTLQVGEAVVGFPFERPFRFRFDLFRGRP